MKFHFANYDSQFAVLSRVKSFFVFFYLYEIESLFTILTSIDLEFLYCDEIEYDF